MSSITKKVSLDFDMESALRTENYIKFQIHQADEMISTHEANSTPVHILEWKKSLQAELAELQREIRQAS